MKHNEIQMFIAGFIFITAYGLIIIEMFDKTIVAISGGALMIILNVIDQGNAFKEIDLNTLGLLISMMIIVMITKKTGIFEYLAIRTVKISRADPRKILILLSIITGLLSGVLDNVTTILLIIPVTLDIAKDLHISPIPFIISEVFASNVGGTGTLIGDPPNIMIGSSVGLTFMDFLKNVGIVILPILFVTTYIFVILYRKKLITSKAAKENIMKLDEKKSIKDVKLLKKCIMVLIVTVLGFVFHGTFHYESATVAMSGAAILLLISDVSPEKILKEVEWDTIFFFVGLFIMVGGLKDVGIIKMMAQGIINTTKGNLMLTTMAILWGSALASAFINNIPFVATMIPLIKDMGALSGMNLEPLWWALVLGACLGGNGTVIGASANVLAVDMAEDYGQKITFRGYFKVAFPVMLFTIILSSLYLFLRFFE